ncbi:MAG: DinB family protein [Armatimonadota bacterium]
MDPYVEPHLHALEDLTRQVVETVTPLDDEQINRTVAGLQNSVGILLRHMAGSERYWIGEVAGGRPAHRNRDTEFGHERLTKSDLLAELERVTALSREVIGGISRDDLMTLVDVQRAKVTKETKAFALMHAAQHLAYHLGQLRYLAKLVQAG